MNGDITYMDNTDVRLLIWTMRGRRLMKLSHVTPDWGPKAKPQPCLVFHRYMQRGGTYDGRPMAFVAWLRPIQFPGRFGAEWEVDIHVDERGGDWDVLARPDTSEPWRMVSMDHVPVIGWAAEP